MKFQDNTNVFRVHLFCAFKVILTLISFRLTNTAELIKRSSD